MADNKNKKVLNVPAKREQNDACICSAEREEQITKAQPKGNVPALRFPEFTEGWATKSISDLATVTGGGTPDTAVKSYWNGDIQWFTPSEIGKNKYVDLSLRTITEEGLNNSSAKLLPPYTILLSSRATVGECSIALQECATNQGFQSLIAKNCDIDFLYYLIQTKKKELMKKACGSTFLEISANEIRKIHTYVPSINEQKKIGVLLSLIDKCIDTQNKIIEKLETLIKGIRHNVFQQLRKDVGFNSTIGDILSFEQPQRYIVSSTEYSDDSSCTPVLTANKAFILGYTTETDGIYSKGDCIIIDDFTLDCKYVSFPFKIKSSAIKILTAENKYILRYIYEYLKSLDISTEEHKRHYITEIQPSCCILPDDKTLTTVALMFESITYKLGNEQSLALMLNKQKQYLLSKMFI